MARKNHRPAAVKITATQAASGLAVSQNVSQTSWGLLLLEGTAKYSNTVVPSAAVNVWENTASTAAPTHTTFTAINGRYGVTVKANKPLIIKVFGQ